MTHADAFLDLIDQGPNTMHMFGALDRTTGRMTQQPMRLSGRRTIRRWAARQAAKGRDLYVCTCPLVPAPGGRYVRGRAYCADTAVIRVDVDGPGAVQLRLLEQWFDLPGTFAVWSGSSDNFHAYVRLAEPVDAVTFTGLARGMVKLFRADPGKVNVEDFLRLPGTANQKPGAGPVRLDPRRRPIGPLLSATELRGRLPEADLPAETGGRPAQGRGAGVEAVEGVEHFDRWFCAMVAGIVREFPVADGARTPYLEAKAFRVGTLIPAADPRYWIDWSIRQLEDAALAAGMDPESNVGLVERQVLAGYRRRCDEQGVA